MNTIIYSDNSNSKLSNAYNFMIIAQLMPNTIFIPVTCNNKLLIHTTYDLNNFINYKYDNIIVSETGHYVSYWSNGQKFIECDFVDGKITGNYIKWYSDG